jgi:hypothetical protein
MTLIVGTDTAARAKITPYVSITLLAILAWGAILFAPQALYWDDWVVVNNDTLAVYSEIGLPWLGPIYVALFAIGPWTFKALALLSTIAVGWATFAISGRGIGLSARERWILSALVVVLPLFSSREIAILGTYSWSTALFFAAWYLLVRKNPGSRGRTRYVVAAALFFASYTTGSLLAFTALPAAHLAYLTVLESTSFRAGIAQFVRRFWWLALAPATFWIMKTVFFQPYGLYENYNQIQLHRDRIGLSALALIFVFIIVGIALAYLLATAHRERPPRWEGAVVAGLTIAAGLVAAFIYLTRVSSSPLGIFTTASLGLACLVLMVSVITRYIRRKRTGSKSRSSQAFEIVLAIGILALVLAIIPYLLVGKLPSFENWETRHQLLMPLGFALIIVAATRSATNWISPGAVRIVSLGFVLAATFVSFSASLSLVADWHKQMQVSAALAENGDVRLASTVVFSDQAPQFNFQARHLDFYEYTGALWTAFGDRTRLGIDQSDVPTLLAGDLDEPLNHPVRYGTDDYVQSDDGVLVEIRPAADASWWGLLFDQPSITIQVTPIDDLSSIH